MKETIAAIATPQGTGGIAVIRVSGPESEAVLSRLFTPYGQQGITDRRLTLGMLADREGPIDEVLAVIMHAPHTYTGETVAEIHCHGGRETAKAVLDAVLHTDLVRLAEPGEFTKRAFLNGKIDLAKAEAVSDMIHATAEKGVRLSARALTGRQSEAVSLLQERISRLIVQLEVAADFPEEDLDIAALRLNEISALIAETDALLKRASRQGYEGIKICIVGKPNAGKSSLLNALADSDRAIVSDIPGTTRDTVSVFIQVEGVQVELVDTAGLRDSDDPIEAMGVDRALQEMEQADLILAVLDGSQERVNFDIPQGKPFIEIVNKSDLPQRFSPSADAIILSAREGTGMDTLLDRIGAFIRAQSSPEDVLFYRQRQIDALRACREALCRGLEALEAGMPEECVVVELRQAWRETGLITGQTADERIIDMIFSSFCLGK